VFDDLLDANRRYRTTFTDSGVSGRAAKGLAVVTCIDSRIEPLAVLGLRVGDAKIIRNAGARITDDTVRSLVIAVNLLDVTRVALLHHTECAMVAGSDHDLQTRITAASGADASGLELFTMADQKAAATADIAFLRACPLVPGTVEIGAFLFDVHTGEVSPLLANA
jgi:carbonic anhydrase